MSNDVGALEILGVLVGIVWTAFVAIATVHFVVKFW